MQKNAKYRRMLERAPALIHVILKGLPPSTRLVSVHAGGMNWSCYLCLSSVTFCIGYDRGSITVSEQSPSGDLSLAGSFEGDIRVVIDAILRRVAQSED